MSIYVSIASLFDPELEYTLNDIFSNADNPDDIYIGLAITSVDDDVIDFMKDFYSYIEDKFKDNKKLQMKLIHGIENHKIGIGRNTAASMYSGQDYFLQIDSHSLLEKGWDTQLIDLHKKAVQETNNEKTVLTAYISGYWHTVDGRVPSNGFTRYPIQCPGSRVSGYGNEESKITIFPLMQDISLYKELPELMNQAFIPSPKFNAQFAFGNKYFAENRGLGNDIIFWEEEIIQSIELFDMGFSLVFPNTRLKVMHFYVDNYNIPNSISKRQAPYRTTLNNVNLMCDNYKKYIDNPENAKKIREWEFYSGLSVYPINKEKRSIPNSYR